MDGIQQLQILPLPVMSTDASVQIPQMLSAEPIGLKFNMLELPEMIIVETRFITQQAAAKAQIETVYTLDAPVKKTLESVVSIQKMIPPSSDTTQRQSPLQRPSSLQGANSIQTQNPLQTFSCTVRTRMTDTCTLTDSPNPSRDRAQQTEVNPNRLTTIGIQCNLEQDEIVDIFDDNISVCTESALEKRNEKEQFLHFIMEKSKLYGNGKYECLMCGEIKSNSKMINSHMALHWGPAALCSHCGLLFEHNVLLSQHRCDVKRSSKKKLNVPRLKCPHYSCRVIAISPLELYDHINEHSGQHIYQCCGCKRSFCTAGELRHHTEMRLQCLERSNMQCLPYSRLNSKYDGVYRLRVFNLHSAKRKRVLVKTFLSARARNVNAIGRRRCQICLKYYSNAYKFSKHSASCRKQYLSRLNKKRNMEEVPQFTLVNGNNGH